MIERWGSLQQFFNSVTEYIDLTVSGVLKRAIMYYIF